MKCLERAISDITANVQIQINVKVPIGSDNIKDSGVQ